MQKDLYIILLITKRHLTASVLRVMFKNRSAAHTIVYPSSNSDGYLLVFVADRVAISEDNCLFDPANCPTAHTGPGLVLLGKQS